MAGLRPALAARPLAGAPEQPRGGGFSAFLLTVVAYSVLFAWLYARTQGSLLAAVVFHAALNFFSVAGIDPARQSWWRALVYCAAAAVVMAAGGLRGLGDGRRRGPSAGAPVVVSRS